MHKFVGVLDNPQKLEYLWNKKRYHKKKSAILLYFEKPFKLAYFWNDLFCGSYALLLA